jgi:lambda family phage portal protein
MPNDAEVRAFLTSLAEAHRQAEISAAEPYRAGEVNRLNRSWQPEHHSGDGAVGTNWDLVTRRVRDLKRNDPAIIALQGTLVDHVIARGIGTTADVTIDGELEEDFCEESDDLWDEWCDDEADLEGKLPFGHMQRQFFHELLETGEGLTLRCWRNDPGRLIPLCYQNLEAEQLDVSKDQPRGQNQNEIRRGIEYDADHRVVGYWLFDAHPNDPYAHYSSKSQFVPADRVIHICLPGRPSASRAISLHTAITQSARDLDNYLGSELTAAIIESLFTLVHKTGAPGAGMGFVGDGSDPDGADGLGNPRIRLGRGIVCQIPKDDDIEPIKVQRPNSQARAFIDLILMLIGMGGGVSRYRLTRDYSGTTYVAARAARLDDKSGFEPTQDYLGKRLPRVVRREWTRVMAAYGQFRTLSATQFRKQERRWTRTALLYPAVDEIDTEKETDADLAAIAGGIETLESICARKGRNWRRVLKQRAREVAYAKRLGLELNYDRPSTPAKPRASDEAGTGANRTTED